MKHKLIIVESPGKASTITSFLGQPYYVVATNGHVRDLRRRNGININQGFKANYRVIDGQGKRVQYLKSESSRADFVYLASDDDREGESIAWHVKEVLNLSDEKSARITFRELSENAVKNAIQNPREIDYNLVDSQQARRKLDRIFGYELSGVLRNRVSKGLAGGRVQSVAIRLIVDKEREINQFKRTPYATVTGTFQIGDQQVKAVLQDRFESIDEAQQFLTRLQGATFTIEQVTTKPFYIKPKPPFTTSTLQQEAHRLLKFPPVKTATLAQQLYDSGYVSYNRTDSVRLSSEAQQSACTEIKITYGVEYCNRQQYQTKLAYSQDSHEAIRPVYFYRDSVGSGCYSTQYGNSDMRLLYQLIWKRAMASQMKDATMNKTTMLIGISSMKDRKFKATENVVTFLGFRSVYQDQAVDNNENTATNCLSQVQVGQLLTLSSCTARNKFTPPPLRYTEASLIKALEAEGIGRPSTYVPIVEKIKDRGSIVKKDNPGVTSAYQQYVLDQNGQITQKECSEVVGAQENALYPSELGCKSTDFLVEHFGSVVDYKFTANMEAELDRIAAGEAGQIDMLQQFYDQFRPLVLKANAEGRQERYLGEDPSSGYQVIAYEGKLGLFVKVQSQSRDAPALTADARQYKIDSITLQQALQVLQNAKVRVLGEYEGEAVALKSGEFGPYLKHKDLTINLNKRNPQTIDIKLAIQLIKLKKKKRIKVINYRNTIIYVERGPYGFYIRTHGYPPVSITNLVKDPQSLTGKQCMELFKNNMV